MADSSYVFIQGTPIEVGSHGQHSLVRESGNPVLDDGGNQLVFERGTGLDGPGITARLFGDTGTIATISTTDDTFRDGGFGYGWDVGDVNEKKKGTFPGAELDDGTTVSTSDLSPFTVVESQDWEDGINAYTDSPSRYAVSKPGDGLNYYPQPGDTWTWTGRGGESSGIFINAFGCQEYPFAGDGTQVANCYDIAMDIRNDEFEIRRHENDGLSTVLETASVTLSADTSYDIEVEWT